MAGASPGGSAQTAGVGAVLAVAPPVATMHREADGESEVVNSALAGMQVRVLGAADGWLHVALPDYTGWMRTVDLAAPAPATGTLAQVRLPRVPLYASSEATEPCGEVFATTTLPVVERTETRVCLARAGAAPAWIAAEAVALRPAHAPPPAGSVEDALALAEALLGTPYLWGGVSALGIDCSGLTQLCCRHAGVTIPRDAGPQYADLPYVVGRGDLRRGDLVFFASAGELTHVGFALGEERVLHASGSAAQVTINSLAPDAPNYSARLAELYAGARRALPTDEARR